ncbi:MAG: S-adenosylmethionine synthase [Candidatus Levybacteria bacterium GW2011_GWB1_35_5]|nr:MAG: S-adenosylmethionine synthase [Candidatus Levybacteria bacterium GW2011_GWB1_35_5]
MDYIFTSESVCSGHPDKICDSISDSILDEVLKQDKFGKVAVETLAGFNRVVIAGEVTANAKVNFDLVARKRIRDLGYTDPYFNFSDKSPVEVYIHEQSREIARGVNKKGAGDQGMMFGFACNETKTLMPLPITIAHRLTQRIDEVREKKILSYLRPDGKSQVTIEYKNGKPYKVLQVVIAVPHKESVDLKRVKKDVYQKVVKKVLDEFGFKISEKDLILNGTGVWHMPGPASDCGLTGRKIIVDTYGGYARVGGGAFSGKDPTKVDRSGAYAARYLAKNIVKEKLADKAEVRLAYFIGAKKPVMQDVETFGSEKTDIKVIKDFMSKLLDTSVEGIIDGLNLRRPIYLKTSAYGHFGREEFPWEK